MSDLAPSESKVQQEAFEYNQPTSEASITSIGALANALREIILPVGSVVYSVLDETTFQSQNTSPTPARWVLADGRDVTGSRYQSLTGSAFIPDLRGIMIRGKNYARSGATGNPDGDLAVGTYTTDRLGAHIHTASVTDPGHTHSSNARALAGGGQVGSGGDSFPGATINAAVTGISVTIASTGTETAPRNVTMNCYIRIN